MNEALIIPVVPGGFDDNADDGITNEVDADRLDDEDDLALAF